MSTTAGYSGTPLLKKLGVSPGTKLLPVNAPPDYFSLFESDIRAQVCKKNDTPELVHLFARDKSELAAGINGLKPVISANKQIIIWVSWYKKTAKMNTDITEDDIRSLALKNGLVDVKVCAVSELWSGLKLVVPLSLR